MKKFIFPCLFMVLLPIVLTCDTKSRAEDEKKLGMRLLLTKKEVSKDCHSDIYDITINGRQVEYTWRHTGFPDEKQKTDSYILSDETLNKLIAYIKKHGLNKNISESRPTGEIGLSVFLTFEINMDSVKTSADIRGMYNRWGAPEKERSNLDNIEYYNWAVNLVTPIENRSDYY